MTWQRSWTWGVMQNTFKRYSMIGQIKTLFLILDCQKQIVSPVLEIHTKWVESMKKENYFILTYPFSTSPVHAPALANVHLILNTEHCTLHMAHFYCMWHIYH